MHQPLNSSRRIFFLICIHLHCILALIPRWNSMEITRNHLRHSRGFEDDLFKDNSPEIPQNHDSPTENAPASEPPSTKDAPNTSTGSLSSASFHEQNANDDTSTTKDRSLSFSSGGESNNLPGAQEQDLSLTTQDSEKSEEWSGKNTAKVLKDCNETTKSPQERNKVGKSKTVQVMSGDSGYSEVPTVIIKVVAAGCNDCQSAKKVKKPCNDTSEAPKAHNISEVSPNGTVVSPTSAPPPLVILPNVTSGFDHPNNVTPPHVASGDKPHNSSCAEKSPNITSNGNFPSITSGSQLPNVTSGGNPPNVTSGQAPNREPNPLPKPPSITDPTSGAARQTVMFFSKFPITFWGVKIWLSRR
ncbi:hypothetical protein O181_058180 [Austropuccinia psidii MF-1]|uniref:Uncharacterized protein n=1 Tax=Austropuccinia psidii MF-1 TaxID=1389203 RepID=A0A9Q3EG07_9BASI|nr:hypothetical protein [Austropuccinia psidii MF-1]